MHKTMCGFGDHLQYSVFECQFSQTDLVRCRHALGKLIYHHDDQVLFVDLGARMLNEFHAHGPHSSPRQP